jgi:putative transposase
MQIGAVRQYLEQQPAHHGFANRLLPPVYRYRATDRVILGTSHAAFELNHHLVFSTERRVSVFSSSLGKALGDYWLQVASKRAFAIDQISVVPDHIHLLVRIPPKMSIEECALALMNNGQHYLGKYYSEALVEVGVDRLWQPSAYAGTCGEISTALIKYWLSKGD